MRMLKGLFVLSVLLMLTVPSPGQVRISQVFGGGGEYWSVYARDYIELYNAGPPQSLNGWSVQYAAATGTSWTVTALPNVVLGTGQYFLVAEAAGTTLTGNQIAALPTPDVTGTISMAYDAAKVALCNTTTALTGATAHRPPDHGPGGVWHHYHVE